MKCTPKVSNFWGAYHYGLLLNFYLCILIAVTEYIGAV